MFCQKTLQSLTQEIINRWSALSLLPPVTGKPTCMWTHPYANGEALQGSHLRKQKPLASISEGTAAVSLLYLLCTYEPQTLWRPSHATRKRHQQLSLLSMQGYECSNPPLCDYIQVIWFLAGLEDEHRSSCFQTLPHPLLEHTLPGHCSLWPLYWAPNASCCTVICLAAYLCNCHKRNFMSGLYGSQFPIRSFSSGV